MKKLIASHKIIILFIVIIAIAGIIIDIIYCDHHIGYMDGKLYYQYLPEFIINNDFSFYVKYPIGTALCELLFFLPAHFITVLTNPTEAIGYGGLYEWAVAIAGLCFFIIGIVFIYNVLLRLYSRKTALISIAVMVLGTPLFLYATKYACFSHIYTFGLCSVLMYFTVALDEKRERFYSFLIGLIIGWLFLVRNVNVLFVLFYLLMGVGVKGEWTKNIKAVFSKRRLPFHIIGGLIITIPQFLYWKHATGDFILNTYSDESFSFILRPKIFEVLFSDAKGLFIFAPILIFAIIGIVFMRSTKSKSFQVPVIVILVYEIFVTAAWWCWWFGGVYFIRTFLDIFAFLSLPLAAMVHEVMAIDGKRAVLSKSIYAVFTAIFIIINLLFVFAALNGNLNETISNWWELRHAVFGL